MFKQMLIGAVLALSLSGCAGTSALSAVTSALSPNKPDLTAQVGASNTKQGIGANVSTEDKNETTVKDSSVGTVDSSKGKATRAQNLQTGSITAETITVKNNDSWDLIWAFLAGLLPLLLVAGVLVWYALKHRRANKEGTDA